MHVFAGRGSCRLGSSKAEWQVADPLPPDTDSPINSRIGRVARVACSAVFSVEQSAEWLLCGIHEGRLLADTRQSG